MINPEWAIGVGCVVASLGLAFVWLDRYAARHPRPRRRNGRYPARAR